MKGKIANGFEFDIDEAKLDDWDLFKAMADMDSQNYSRILSGTVKFSEIILGEQEKDLVAHIRKQNNGKCSTDDMTKCIMEIIEQCKELKNLESSQEQ